MRKFFTPHKNAILIAWFIFGALCVIAHIALGPEWFIPMIWPFVFVIYVTWLIVRWERRISRTTPGPDLSDQFLAAEARKVLNLIDRQR